MGVTLKMHEEVWLVGCKILSLSIASAAIPIEAVLGSEGETE
jgi:hypothetical protein